MPKRGFLGLGVIGFFLMLFLLFYFLNSTGFLEVTGFASHEGPTNLTINEVLITKIGLVNGNINVVNGSLHIYDNVACAVDYELTSGGTTNLTLNIYSPRNSVENPNKIFFNIFNDNLEETECKDNVCLAYYNVTEYIFGNWRCAASWDNRLEVSNELEMENSAPILVKNIQDINLNLDGSYAGIDLDDYFKDLENDDLEYGAVGQSYLAVEIKSNGDVKFYNTENYEGTEKIKFRAHDGLKGTFSNEIIVKVGSGISSTPVVCNSVWDCNWGECVNGKQKCAYFDRNNCGINTGKPNDLTKDCEISQAGSGSVKPLVLTGTLEIEKPALSGMKRTLVLVGIVVIVLAMAGFGVYLLYRKPAAKESVELVQQPRQNIQQQEEAVNLPELQNYIEAALREGQGRQKIEMDLLKVGWQKSDIENNYNLIMLKKFVKEKLGSGFSKEKIMESLKSKGWKDDILNAVFKSV